VQVGRTNHIDALLRLASRPERIGSNSGLAQAIAESGVFLERRLAGVDDAPRAGIGSDLKAAVLRALAQARIAVDGVEGGRLNAGDAQALSELRRELEAGLGRITLNQLATAPGDSPSRAWQLEIPVYHAAVFHTLVLRIERDDAGRAGSGLRGESEAPWRVRLQLAPPSIGEVHLDLRVSDTRVALALAAERTATRQLLDAAMGQLRDKLAARGMDLETTPVVSLAASTVPGPLRAAGDGVDLRA